MVSRLFQVSQLFESNMTSHRHISHEVPRAALFSAAISQAPESFATVLPADSLADQYEIHQHIIGSWWLTVNNRFFSSASF